MDKNASYKIIQDTLEGAFDKNKFLLFVKNLCNQIDESKAFQLSGAYIPDAFRGYIKSYERLGTFTDPEDKKIDVLIVYLQKDTSLERARTAQRNFVARYLKDRDQKDAGLVAFVSPNSEDWRFSLIKMEYKFTEGKSGKVKVKEEFTPARRWSFLVGTNENSHTAKSRLAPIVQDDEHNPSLKIFEEAFNIEKVTKEFFEKYRELFLRTNETLDEVVKINLAIKKDFTAKSIDTVDFAKKLLGQIVFLYFLQKKGWFGVERNSDWGSGPKNFLRQLFDKKHSDYSNFFNDILEPLFYEALARERDHDFYSRFNCKIPFLNGGLFDPINNYDWVHTDILLPDDLFSNERKTKEGDIGDGILDIYDRYNFTVKEDEPLEKEVAIDPEVLGKIFEKLGAITPSRFNEWAEAVRSGNKSKEQEANKKLGVYYTPREIVHYMCVQSLVNYLDTELHGKILQEDLERFIKYGEMAVEHETLYAEKTEQNPDYKGRYDKTKLPVSIEQNAEIIDRALANIKVCDPAIGSGAFPVGMMTEIVRARNTLSSYLRDSDRTPYNFKRDCIQNSLYGVDVDPGAVEIAKLRLWLSLVVDEDDIKQIKPLPNLDYKIMQGNSLLEEFGGIKLFDEKLISAVNFDKEKQIEELKEKQNNLSSEYIKLHQANKLTDVRREEIDTDLKKLVSQIKRLSQSEKAVADNGSLFDIYSTAKKKADELKKLHKEFFETTQKKKKDDFKKQIENLEWDLIEATLKEQGKISELKKVEEFKKSNIKPFFLWKLHFADVFQEKGGFDVVIANPPYGANIDDMVETYRNIYPEVIKNYADIYKIFFDIGLRICKPFGVETYITPNTFLAQPRYKDLRGFLINYKIEEILNLGEEVFEGVVVPVCITIMSNTSTDNSYLFADISVQGKYSGNLANVGFRKVSLDDVFNVPDMSLLQQFSLKKDEAYLDKILEIKDAGIQYHRSGIGLKNKGGNDLYERIFDSDLKKFKKNQPVWYGKLVDKYSVTDRTDEYFNLSYKDVLKKNESVSFSMGAFEQSEKILWRQTAAYLIATIDIKKRWFRNTLQCAWLKEEFRGKIDLRYVLANLNSKYFKYLYYKIVNESAGRVFPQVKLTHVKKLPIKTIDIKQQNPFIELVDTILSITRTNNYLDNAVKKAEVQDYIKRLDKMIFKLYELTPVEIEMVENSSTK